MSASHMNPLVRRLTGGLPFAEQLAMRRGMLALNRFFWVILPCEALIGLKLLIYQSSDVVGPIVFTAIKALIFVLVSLLASRIAKLVIFLAKKCGKVLYPARAKILSSGRYWLGNLFLLWIATDVVWLISVLIKPIDSVDAFYWAFEQQLVYFWDKLGNGADFYYFLVFTPIYAALACIVLWLAQMLSRKFFSMAIESESIEIPGSLVLLVFVVINILYQSFLASPA